MRGAHTWARGARRVRGRECNVCSVLATMRACSPAILPIGSGANGAIHEHRTQIGRQGFATGWLGFDCASSFELR
eukprot:3613975-Prymnesium_polylepis.1